jgi:exosortase C (VPDSG-CTERM-specific)
MKEEYAEYGSHLRGFLFSVVALLLCFSWPLIRLLRYALLSDLYSYIILIPFVSGYLIWNNRKNIPALSKPNRMLAFLCGIAGMAVLGGYLAKTLPGGNLAVEDSLAFLTLSFVLLFWGLCGWFLGKQAVRSIAFPLGFLVFLVPFPVFLRFWIETFLQYCSAYAALALFDLTGMPVFYNDLTFQLPTITLLVAPECSGIHSSLALLITSILAGQLFLHSNWKRCALAFAVLPVAILRNGFRIFTIGELCVHVGPEMVDSNIHHKGGPIFFILSLVPLLALLLILIKSERSPRMPLPIQHEA